MAYIPRLNEINIRDNPKWYYLNPFYPQYQLPNCTCYAWGRWWEINDPLGYERKPTLNTSGNAKAWWGNNKDKFESGQTPRLGAIICFAPEPNSNRNGHVAVVEQINGNVITTSNSDWRGRFFYTEVLTPDANNKYHHSVYTSQGFLYNPYVTEDEVKVTKKPLEFPWAIAWKHWSNFKH